jgi:hypothetical protein
MNLKEQEAAQVENQADEVGVVRVMEAVVQVVEVDEVGVVRVMEAVEVV